MKIAISNIAWAHNEDKEILPIFKKYSIKGVEIAPTMVWEDPVGETERSIKKYRKFWEDKDVNVISTQSMLFGHPELTIFESSEKRNVTLEYLKKMIWVSATLGAKAIVFGSPENRARRGVEPKEALEIAYNFFNKLGDTAKSNGIFFCIEPNPKEYGTDFINNTEEVIELVKKVNNPYLRIHLDSGVMFVNGENYGESIKNAISHMEHFHISERNLEPIGSTGVPHDQISELLRKYKYDGWTSIEMRMKNNNSNARIVDKSLMIASEFYS